MLFPQQEKLLIRICSVWKNTFLQATIISTKTVNKLASDDNNNGDSGSGEHFDSCNDVLALFGFAKKTSEYDLE